MSNDEQEATLGRAVREYGEERRKLATLLARASEYADTLRAVADYLKPRDDHSGYDNLRNSMKPSDRQREAIAKLPTQQQVNTVVSEANEATTRKRQLRKTLADAGVELQD